MNLRGLEMLLALTGCVLFFGLVSGNLTALHLLWAIAGIGTVLGITAGVMRTLFPHLKETRRWELFTEKVGRSLTLHSRGGVQKPSLSGQVASCHVSISPVDREYLIMVSVPTSAHTEGHEITLEPRGETNALQRSLSLGDPDFDSQVVLRGDLPETVAVLDAETRELALGLMNDLSVQVRRRHAYKYGRHLELDPEGTWLCLERMAHLADRLFRLPPGQGKRKLAQNARTDPIPRVRALNLRLLFEYYPPDQETLLLGRLALSDDELPCVLEGAIGLAEAGDAIDKPRAFRHLADIARGEPFSEDLRSSAIEALTIHFPERAPPIIAAIANEDGPLPSALLSSMVSLGLPHDVERLIPRALMAEEEAQLEIVRWLTDRGPRFERLSCALLDSRFERVQHEIVEVLLRTGTIAAVEHLLPLTRGLLRAKGLRERAQHAVRSIQSRLAGADGGQLSISDPSRGELSFGRESGALSYGED